MIISYFLILITLLLFISEIIEIKSVLQVIKGHSFKKKVLECKQFAERWIKYQQCMWISKRQKVKSEMLIFANKNED